MATSGFANDFNSSYPGIGGSFAAGNFAGIFHARSSGKRRGRKARQANADANAAARAAVDARNKATTGLYDEQTEFRGGLIDAQRGGLASTMLNLGGAAGDPENPFASQLVGTQAAGSAPILEQYKDVAYAAPRKKNRFRF